MSDLSEAKKDRGRMAFHGGQAAEDIVARHYAGLGVALVARRWRGTQGEIDLILREGDVLVFVEVKKSASFRSAGLLVSRSQQQRILSTALEFVAQEPAGLLSDMRFDVALVDGIGAVEIVENAFMGD